MSAITLTAKIERFPTAGSWTISRGTVPHVQARTAEAPPGAPAGRRRVRPAAAAAPLAAPPHPAGHPPRATPVAAA